MTSPRRLRGLEDRKPLAFAEKVKKKLTAGAQAKAVGFDTSE